MALNKNKPYGEVCCTTGSIKYKYEQDGKFFDAQGNEVDKAGNAVALPQAAEIPENPNEKLTVAELKDALDDLGVIYDPSLKKADLVTLLTDEQRADD
jgi:hypothetical protein